MPPIDETTTNRAYPKPNAANTLAYDVAKLRTALDAIDDDIAPYIKKDVVCATTANITLSGNQTIDGIAVVAGNRVLARNQTNLAENGIYVASATAWARATDMNTAIAAANAITGVERGTVNGGKIFTTPFKATDTIGVTAMNWYQFVDTSFASTTTPGNIGTAAIGASTTYARADHVHDLPNTAVTAGSYTTANITVDAKGRITAASSGASGVTSFSAGTTGLTPSTGTTGTVTLAGTLAVANGGTGVTTSTGSGSVVLSTSPSLTTPILGTPTSGTLTNCTGYTFANIATKPTTRDGYGITDVPKTDGTGASGTWGISITGNAATATNLSNTGTTTLASATESNSVYITAPTYTTDQPVKLLNFDWYGNLFSIGNIRSGSTPSSGFGVFYTASGGSRTEIARFGIGGGLNVVGAITQAGSQVLTASNYTTYTPGLTSANAFTGANTFTNAAGITVRQTAIQDGITLNGRGAGTGGLLISLTPEALSANVTQTLPNIDGRVQVAKAVSYASTGNISARAYSAGVLSGYDPNVTFTATTTAGSAVVICDTTSVIQDSGSRIISIASQFIPGNLSVTSKDSATQITLNSATRTLTITSITGNGTTAQINHTSATWPNFAAGAVITIAGSTGAAYDGSWTVVSATTTSTTINNTNTIGQAASGGTISQTISAGTASVGLRNTITAFTIDGVSPAVGTRVLLKDQLTIGGFPDGVNPAIYNGIYTVTVSGTSLAAWSLTRATDADTSAKMAGLRVNVDLGTSRGLTYTTNFFGVLDTSPIYFTDGTTISGYGQVPTSPTVTFTDHFSPGGTRYIPTTSHTAVAGSLFAPPTFSYSSAKTFTDAATLYVSGSAIAGRNVTVTNPWSLYVGSSATDNSFFNGPVSIGGIKMLGTRGSILTLTLISGGAGYTDGTYNNVNLTGGLGAGAKGNITVTGGVVTTIVLASEGLDYQVSDVLSSSTPVGTSAWSASVATVRPHSLRVHSSSLSNLRISSGITTTAANTEIGSLSFAWNTPTIYGAGDKVRIVASQGTSTGTSDLRFYLTALSTEPATRAITFAQDGGLYTGGKTVYSSLTGEGLCTNGAGVTAILCTDNTPLTLNRLGTTDGLLVNFLKAGVQQGSIQVLGTTVSYNGAHLSRWSQLPGENVRREILRGTVLSNVDEMCEWGDEENEQLNKMIISNIEYDTRVSGVFANWDEEDDVYLNDFYCAMTGDYIIRIGPGVSVACGDLLVSAGDGTAKPQQDDIVRSSTIAKVTSSHVTYKYEDDSYCVPCVLMV